MLVAKSSNIVCLVHMFVEHKFCYQVGDDEILSLQERLAAYNFAASSDQSTGKHFNTAIILNPPIKSLMLIDVSTC